MSDLPAARQVLRGRGPAEDRICLTYDARLIRRRRLVTEGGVAVLVDLPEVTDLADGDRLVTGTGRAIAIVAAEEPLMEVTGDLPRLAWHIGNRHAPCQFDGTRLLLPRETVMRRMLEGLGAQVRDVDAPFTPEGGAYGQGRVMGHDHSGPHAHAHDPSAPDAHAHDDPETDHPRAAHHHDHSHGSDTGH